MIIRNEDGSLFIVDGIYEPPPIRAPRWRPHLFVVLALLVAASGALILLGHYGVNP